MASIQKKNKFRKLHLCPWSFAQGQKEKVNKKMEEKEEKEKKEKEKGKELEKWKGSWSQREVTTIDEFEMVPDSEDDCQMFCWDQKKKKVQEKMAKAKDEKDKELERLWAPLKWRPCTELFLGLTQSLPLQVSEDEIQFSKKLNLHVKTKHKIHIDRERGRDRLHRDRMAKAEWPELSQRRIEFNGWQKHISEDPEEYVEIGCDVQSGLN